MSNLLIWLGVVLGGMVVAVIILLVSKRVSAENFSRFGQGIAAIAAAGGIVAGGALFIAEGRTRPRLLLQVTSTVLGTRPTAGPQEKVYVQVVTTIENQGLLSPATIECAALDAFEISPSSVRDPLHANDLALPSLLTADGDHGIDWDRCLQREARQAGAGYARPASGFRWANFDLQPGQIKTRNYELLVPCTLSGIRVLVKIPDPMGGVLERKVVVSLVSVCSGQASRDVTTVADADTPPPPASGASSAPPANGSSTGNSM